MPKLDQSINKTNQAFSSTKEYNALCFNVFVFSFSGLLKIIKGILSVRLYQFQFPFFIFQY